MYTPKKIRQALTVIKDTCLDYSSCEECPFCGGSTCGKYICQIREKRPNRWAIALPSTDNWKAFKEV